MTTIAYRNGVLAADSRAVDEYGIIPGYHAKLVRNAKDGSILGIIGRYSQARKIIRWLRDGEDEENIPIMEGCTIVRLLLEREKIHPYIIVYNNGDPPLLVGNPEYAAWGTGGPIAWGALAMGASPMKAVQVASRHDPFTDAAVYFNRRGGTIEPWDGQEIKEPAKKRKTPRSAGGKS